MRITILDGRFPARPLLSGYPHFVDLASGLVALIASSPSHRAAFQAMLCRFWGKLTTDRPERMPDSLDVPRYFERPLTLVVVQQGEHPERTRAPHDIELSSWLVDDIEHALGGSGRPLRPLSLPAAEALTLRGFLSPDLASLLLLVILTDELGRALTRSVFGVRAVLPLGISDDVAGQSSRFLEALVFGGEIWVEVDEDALETVPGWVIAVWGKPFAVPDDALAAFARTALAALSSHATPLPALDDPAHLASTPAPACPPQRVRRRFLELAAARPPRRPSCLPTPALGLSLEGMYSVSGAYRDEDKNERPAVDADGPHRRT
ncbi:hypothetical protein JCM8097_001204 [Rhodosporidiobolus ruineniae]